MKFENEKLLFWIDCIEYSQSETVFVENLWSVTL